MANTRAKEVSESYKGSEVTFDKTTAGAVAKGFVSTTVQAAIEEAKYVAPALPIASQTVAGIVRGSTDAEALNGSAVNAYITPPQLAAKVANYYANTIIPALPLVVYGGQGSLAQMTAVFGGYPVGSFVVFDEYYTYTVGWGNGSSVVGGYRRRTITKTSNSGWQFLHFA